MGMTTEVRNPFEWGPYVQVAAFCERVLREADGVASLIRLVDVITHMEHRPDAPEEMPVVRYPLTLMLSLKSGSARGRHEISITPEQPSGETLPPLTMSIRMEGEGKGTQILSRIDIPYRLEGLYWFHVRFDGQVITRMPLEVRYSRLVTGPASQSSGLL